MAEQNLKTYTFSGNSMNFDAALSVEEVRERIARTFPEVRNADFEATPTGGAFVVRTGNKG